ncbi:MAG TPA: asparagine synthase (glutamine-hydrolyzing), partial [Candidatus Nitrosocosmicus sp.]|nr:asparagine synthase (glutamine-hydrolyzing) [Candidatus Nitrosocosmicus sp.]
MCGIAGFYGFKNEQLIKKFSKEIEHRGPDGEGFYLDEDVSLLNRRLAIIDVKGGDQPIYNEDKSIVVVYNGEIYNYQELRDQLEKKGHLFKTRSDTEIIVHLYEEKGDNCFKEFNGMFAIALYDIKKKKLILARDQFGIKPLYYSILPKTSNSTSQIVFASEIKPILYSGLITAKPNDKTLYRYLRYRIHDDLKESFFEDIYRLLPGEVMTVEKDNISIKKYFDPSDIRQRSFDTAQDDKAIIQQFKEKLIDAVRLRLISEVPVGTSFSGGLDSSSVVAIVNKLLLDHVKETESVGKKQKTFSAVFPGSTNDEEQYVDAVIKKINKDSGSIVTLEIYKVKPSVDEFFKDLKDFVKTQEEPTISTGPYAQYCVMKEARKHITVLLDGQGADEMMAGYLPYYYVYLKDLWSNKQIKDLVLEVITGRDIFWKFVKQKINIKLGKDSIIHPHTFLNKEFIMKNKSAFVTNGTNLKARLMEDVFKNSLQSLLRYEDKNTMRFSIEGRVPFLDINLLQFIFSLPNKFIIRNGWNKYILREAVRDLLP